MKERNYGIDLLRIVLMMMVILGHLFAHTELRATLPLFSPSWFFTWIVQTITICSVDCFILISGYFGYNSKVKAYSVVSLWGKVLFYSIIIPIVLSLIGIPSKLLYYISSMNIQRAYGFQIDIKYLHTTAL